MITFDENKEEIKPIGEENDVEVGIAEEGAPVGDIVEAADAAAEEAEKNISEEIKEAVENVFSMNENTTLFHKGNLRSGRSIEYDGSVVLLGDVNPGAQIKAKGNILVLGAIKGTVHAGCDGSREAFVFGLTMRPVQLRIGDIITRFPDNMPKENSKPEYAYVEDGKIYVSEF